MGLFPTSPTSNVKWWQWAVMLPLTVIAAVTGLVRSLWRKVRR